MAGWVVAGAAGDAAGRLGLHLHAGDDDRSPILDIEARVERQVPGERWLVMVAVFEDDLVTPVSRGENGGRELRNSHVVRSLDEAFSLPVEAGTMRSGTVVLDLEPSWRRSELGVAVFLQDPETRRIHGAASLRLDDG